MTNGDELDIKEVPVGAYNFMGCWHTDDRGGYRRNRGGQASSPAPHPSLSPDMRPSPPVPNP